MNKKIAYVFPGQGSQKVGMLNALFEKQPSIKHLFDQASDVLSYDLWQLVSEGPSEQLNQTIYTQPAVYVADMALWHVWRAVRAESPVALAGHSLGEYAALGAAGVFSFIDGLKLVQKRAELMQYCSQLKKGAMAAVIGLTDEQVRELCQQVSPEGNVVAANYNSHGQVVVAGEQAVVERLVSQAKPFGARMAKLIPVSVASHCFLMQPAVTEFGVYLNDIEFLPAQFSVINNVDVAIIHDAEKIKDALLRQLCHPVRWVETIEAMVVMGAEQVIECGPNKVLSGLIKRIDANVELFNISEMEREDVVTK